MDGLEVKFLATRPPLLTSSQKEAREGSREPLEMRMKPLASPPELDALGLLVVLVRSEFQLSTELHSALLGTFATLIGDWRARTTTALAIV
jgi:hypothetical protein